MNDIRGSDLSRPSFVDTSRTSVGSTDSGMRISSVSHSEMEGVETPSRSSFYAKHSFSSEDRSSSVSFLSSTSSLSQQARVSNPGSSRPRVSLTFSRMAGILQGIKTRLGMGPKKVEDSEKVYARITEQIKEDCLVGATAVQKKTFGLEEAAATGEAVQLNQENISEADGVHVEVQGVPTKVLDKVPSDLAAAFGLAALYFKAGEIKEAYRDYKEANIDDKKEALNNLAENMTGGTLLVAGIGKSAVGITEQILTVDEHLASVSTDTAVAAAGMAFNFITGGLATAYHSYKTYKYAKALSVVNTKLVEVNKQIEANPGDSKLVDCKEKLIEDKKCLNTLIAMNSLGAAAGSLVVIAASFALVGLAGAACCTGIGAGVVGGVVVGIGIYMYCRNNRKNKSAMSGDKPSTASFFQSTMSSMSNISFGMSGFKESLSKRMDVLGMASTYKDVGSWSV
jgi:hypothetical protein